MNFTHNACCFAELPIEKALIYKMNLNDCIKREPISPVKSNRTLPCTRQIKASEKGKCAKRMNGHGQCGYDEQNKFFLNRMPVRLTAR
jgi:hypothetical protein